MSVKRDVIANILNIPEEQVRCENCSHSKKFVCNAYVCDMWDVRILSFNDFCSFFAERKEK